MSTRADQIENARKRLLLVDSIRAEKDPAKKARMQARLDSLSTPTTSNSHGDRGRKRDGIIRSFLNRRKKSDPIQESREEAGTRMRGSIKSSSDRQVDSLKYTNEALERRLNTATGIDRRKIQGEQAKIADQIQRGIR